MGSSVKKTPNSWLNDEIKAIKARLKELEENALIGGDVVANTLKLGEPDSVPGEFGDAVLAGDLTAEGALNIGEPTTPATADGDGAIEGNLNVEGNLSGGTHNHDADYADISDGVTGGDSHDHVGGDGAEITESALSSGVTGQLVTGGDNHNHDGGDGAAIDTNALANLAVTEGKLATAVQNQLVTGGDSHDHAGGDGAQIDTAGLVDSAVETDKINNGAVDLNKIADNAVYDHHVGYRVPMFTRRVGGSATNWSTAGTNDYTPTSVKMQGGCHSFNIAASAYSDSETIWFPQSFDDPPLVVAVPLVSALIGVNIDSVGSGSFAASVWRPDANGSQAVDVMWIAIGKE